LITYYIIFLGAPVSSFPQKEVPDVKVVDYSWVEDVHIRSKAKNADLPVIGAMQGRLSKKELMNIWRRHDPEGVGELRTSDCKVLVKEIIMLLPGLIRETGRHIILPLRTLADVTGDELYIQQAEEVEHLFEEEIEPMLKMLEIRMKAMAVHRFNTLIESLISRLDVNHDGSVDTVRILSLSNVCFHSVEESGTTSIRQ